MLGRGEDESELDKRNGDCDLGTSSEQVVALAMAEQGFSSHHSRGNKRKGSGQSLINLLLGILSATHRPPSGLLHHPESTILGNHRMLWGTFNIQMMTLVFF